MRNGDIWHSAEVVGDDLIYRGKKRWPPRPRP